MLPPRRSKQCNSSPFPIAIAAGWARCSRSTGRSTSWISAARPDFPADLVEFLQIGEAALTSARQALASPDRSCLAPRADVALLAPIPRPGKIVCLGHNYFDHIGIGKTEPPEYPTFFCKTANTVIGPGQAIIIPP